MNPIIRETLAGTFSVSILDPSNPIHNAGDFAPHEILLNILTSEKAAEEYAIFFRLWNN